MECEMCAAAGEDYRLLYKDEFCFCVVNREMMKKGHIMVIPMRHVTELCELSAEESGAIISLIWKMEHAVRRKYGEEVLVVLNRGSHCSQEHIHFHILPSKGNMRNLVSCFEGVPYSKEANAKALRAVKDEIKSYMKENQV